MIKVWDGMGLGFLFHCFLTWVGLLFSILRLFYDTHRVVILIVRRCYLVPLIVLDCYLRHDQSFSYRGRRVLAPKKLLIEISKLFVPQFHTCCQLPITRECNSFKHDLSKSSASLVIESVCIPYLIQ